MNRYLAHAWNGTVWLRPWNGTLRDPGLCRCWPRASSLGAADVTLNAGDLREIEEAVSKITIQGVRFPAHLA